MHLLIYVKQRKSADSGPEKGRREHNLLDTVSGLRVPFFHADDVPERVYLLSQDIDASLWPATAT
jgi:hypothetical protein